MLDEHLTTTLPYDSICYYDHDLAAAAIFVFFPPSTSSSLIITPHGTTALSVMSMLPVPPPPPQQEPHCVTSDYAFHGPVMMDDDIPQTILLSRLASSLYDTLPFFLHPPPFCGSAIQRRLRRTIVRTGGLLLGFSGAFFSSSAFAIAMLLLALLFLLLRVLRTGTYLTMMTT